MRPRHPAIPPPAQNRSTPETTWEGGGEGLPRSCLRKPLPNFLCGETLVDQIEDIFVSIFLTYFNACLTAFFTAYFNAFFNCLFADYFSLQFLINFVRASHGGTKAQRNLICILFNFAVNNSINSGFHYFRSKI